MAATKTKSKIPPYWATLLIGIVLACIVTNLITMGMQAGTFTSWIALGAPPSGAKHIINASTNLVSVETREGKYFTAWIHGSCEDEKQRFCWEWKPGDPAADEAEFQFPGTRGADCRDLGDESRSNPRGQVVECIHAVYPGADFGVEAYFALMQDGTIQYWENGGSTINMVFLFVISTIAAPLLVGLVISISYLIRYFVMRGRAETGTREAPP